LLHIAIGIDMLLLGLLVVDYDEAASPDVILQGLVGFLPDLGDLA
jgi:hypothetical protein